MCDCEAPSKPQWRLDFFYYWRHDGGKNVVKTFDLRIRSKKRLELLSLKKRLELFKSQKS